MHRAQLPGELSSFTSGITPVRDDGKNYKMEGVTNTCMHNGAGALKFNVYPGRRRLSLFSVGAVVEGPATGTIKSI